MQFEFATATRIIFGAGHLSRVGQLAAPFGRRAFIVSGLSNDAVQTLSDTLQSSSIDTAVFHVTGEPTIDVIRQGVSLAKHFEASLVIGFGGGSALDSAKATAALMTNPGDITDYLEVVGRGQELTIPPLPIIAIPTTAGTGSEVTRNAVIGAPEFGIKVSLRSPLMLPRLAIIDPELTYNLPPELTANTGLDALTQLIEPFVCNMPNPITDGFCREGMTCSAKALSNAYRDGHDIVARQNLCIASLLGGLALANSRLGVVHGIAGVLGGQFPIPHGAICACLLPIVMKVNLKALQTRAPDSPSIARYRQVAHLLTGNPQAEENDGTIWVQELCKELNVQSLEKFGVQRNQISDIVDKALRASSTKGNPIPLSNEEFLEILDQAI